MKNSIAVVALALSLLSLGFQAHKAKPAARFDKFVVPASISEFDYKAMQADQQMIRNAIEAKDGIGVPFVRKITDDRQRIVVRVLISEQSLPTGYDARKKALYTTAQYAAFLVASEFGLTDHGIQQVNDTVLVEFIELSKLPQDDKPYAEYVRGELIVH